MEFESDSICEKSMKEGRRLASIFQETEMPCETANSKQGYVVLAGKAECLGK